MVPSSGCSDAFQELEQRRLAAAVRADQSDANAGRKNQVQIFEKPAAAKRLADALGFDQTLGLAFGRGEIDLGRAGAAARRRGGEFFDQPPGRIDARARLAGAGLRSAAQPLDLAAHFGRQRILLLGLRLQKILALLQKLAVVAVHLERALRIHAVDFHHLRGDALEKVAIVRDDQGGARGFNGRLQPQDAFEIQVIGGLVEQQHVGRCNQRGRDGQPLLPSAGERRGGRGGVLEFGAAQHQFDARAVFSSSSKGRSGQARASSTEPTVSPGAKSESCGT